MITLKRFRRIEDAVRSAGYGSMIDWSESIEPPSSAEEFARAAIYVICISGMKNAVAAPIAARCIEALNAGKAAATIFGHPGKAAAIDAIWQRRSELFERYSREYAKLEVLRELPWVGPVTVYHLAKNLDADTAKPHFIWSDLPGATARPRMGCVGGSLARQVTALPRLTRFSGAPAPRGS